MSELWALAAVYAGEYGNKPEVISVGTRKQVDADIDSHANELDASTDWGVVRVGTVHGNPTCRDERTCHDVGSRWSIGFRCDVCGFDAGIDDDESVNFSTDEFNYCPNCGARVVYE